jgi:predicted amidohydrolase
MDPSFSASGRGKMIVAACQQPLHEPLTKETLQTLRNSKAEFVGLPEHYPLPKEIRTLEEAASIFERRKEYLSDLSHKLKCVMVGGTLTEKTDRGFYNTCYVFDSGEEVGFYRKVHPTPREVEAGVLKGEEFKIFYVRNVKIGVLICADVLNLSSFDELASLQCQLTFIPTASPLRKGESIQDKLERDRSIFLEGSRKMNCPVVKTCGVGTTFGHPLQGRSLIATPEKIVARAEPDQENQQLLLITEL